MVLKALVIDGDIRGSLGLGPGVALGGLLRLLLLSMVRLSFSRTAQERGVRLTTRIGRLAHPRYLERCERRSHTYAPRIYGGGEGGR